MKAAALVAGIGNIFLGDDAFGSVVARRMIGRAYPPAVRVIDFGIRGFDLAFALMENYQIAILIDAFPHAAPPGSLRVLELQINPEERRANAFPETHGIAPTRALQLAQQFGIRAQKVYLVGCEPETLEPNENGDFTLSPTVARSVEPAIELVEEMLAPMVPAISTAGQQVCQSQQICMS
jgi:hydrogenase maturation protease